MTNKETVEKWYTELDKENFAGIQEMMDEKHQFHSPMSPEPMSGEEHLGMMKSMHSSFSGTHNIKLSIAEGDHVAISGSWSGKHIGEFNGIAATGNANKVPINPNNCPPAKIAKITAIGCKPILSPIKIGVSKKLSISWPTPNTSATLISETSVPY